MKIKTKRINWPRLILQWGIVAFILILGFFPSLIIKTPADFEAYCPFGGLQALGSYFLSDSLSCTMTSAQMVMGVVLVIGVVLFSKLFCSYICPIGTVSEWLGKLGDKLKIRFTIKGIADKALRSLKYAFLFITVYFTLQSNELFCKKIDPYYALASGFDTDVVILYAVIAIVAVVFGSIFIRLFWCKYLCPFGALSNIFKFTLFFVATLGIYLVLISFGLEISYVWPLAVACAGGFLIELLGQKSKWFPVAKITRNADTCTDCKLCSKKCPQAIDVASLHTVKHVDCNLCGDCLLVCPVKNTLTINKQKKLKWLPVVATVVLAVLGIILGSLMEVPTIDQKWYEDEEMANYQVYEQSGLKNVKCYGSSVAFANKMKHVDGVYGVATFVKQHRVKIYYNPDQLSPEKLQEAIFTPQKKTITPVPKGVPQVSVATLQLENFFDSFDFNYLSILLGQKTGAVGVVSEYACPVIVKIYFASGDNDSEKLATALESKILEYETTAGITSVELGYKVASKIEWSAIPTSEYAKMMFVPYSSSFNNRADFTDDILKTYSFRMGKNRTLSNRYPYLVSHLSHDNGIVEFKTRLDSLNFEVADVVYVDTMTNTVKILKSLLSDSLKIQFSDGRAEKVKNMFDFRDMMELGSVDTVYNK